MPKTILLVDDEEIGSTEELLSNLGYFVVSYTRGNKALRECQQGLRYDLALVDLSLPDISGNEVIISLKQLYPKIPVVSFSGYGSIVASADAHFTKPILSPRKRNDFQGTLERLLSSR